jgi:uncharacterized lipoprotein YmbA
VTMRTVSPAWRDALPKVACVALCVALVGCASAPQERRWLSLPLDVSLPTASAPATTHAIPKLRLQRVQIPEYLQSNRVRFRDSAATLAEWPGVRWAERLEIGLTRHLGLQLAELGQAGWICAEPCNTVPAGGSLQLNYVMLDHDRPAARLHALAQWTLIPPPGSASAPRQGQRRWSEAVLEDTPAGQAAAMARVNAAIARDIAQQLRP